MGDLAGRVLRNGDVVGDLVRVSEEQALEYRARGEVSWYVNPPFDLWMVASCVPEPGDVLEFDQ